MSICIVCGEPAEDEFSLLCYDCVDAQDIEEDKEDDI